MKRIIAIVMVLVTLFSFSSCGVKLSETPTRDFSVTDSSGNAVNLSDFFGKPIVVNFWATWCGYCVEEFPAFENVYKDLGEEVIFLMVNSGEDETVAKSFISDLGHTFPLYFDKSQVATKSYNIDGFPTTLFIRANGELAYIRSGAMNEDTLREYISKIS